MEIIGIELLFQSNDICLCELKCPSSSKDRTQNLGKLKIYITVYFIKSYKSIAFCINFSLVIPQQCMQDFSFEGSTGCLDDPIFRAEAKFYYWAKPRNYRVIFQKCALKLLQIWKILRKLSSFALTGGKIRINAHSSRARCCSVKLRMHVQFSPCSTKRPQRTTEGRYGIIRWNVRIVKYKGYDGRDK